MIRNIVFDMGNVLVKFDPGMFMTREAILDPEDRQIVMRELFQSVEWAQMDMGVLNEDTLEPLVLPRVPERLREKVKGKLIRGSSGKGGGYRLCRRPQDYTVGEIIELTEGTLAPIACLAADAGECPRKDRCRTLPFWHEFDTMVHDFFYSRRLSDLLPAPSRSP